MKRVKDSGDVALASAADVLEWQLPRAVLETLLKDRTTGRNIVWGYVA